MADPPLTSVAYDLERIGFEVAALLDRLMSGQSPPEEPVYVEPLGVVTRQSTDTIAISDPKLAAAVRYIREHACDGINVPTVARQAGLSRRALERRFQKYLGRAPHNEILRLQLRRVKSLLTETDLPLKAIAIKAGFARASHLAVIFRKKTGQTPGEYRRETLSSSFAL